MNDGNKKAENVKGILTIAGLTLLLTGLIYIDQKWIAGMVTKKLVKKGMVAVL